jgi:formate/nitrite transporter FocA (FNT family)
MGNLFVGAVLFALGLITICIYRLNLYTGKIGYVLRNKSFKEVSKILGVNLIAGYVLGYVVKDLVAPEVIAKTVQAKLIQSPWITFIKSYFCGMIMFLAVDMYKKNSNLGIFFGIPAFILSGFEHCIANIIYFGMNVSVSFLSFLIINVLGNSIGSIVTETLLYNKEED